MTTLRTLFLLLVVLPWLGRPTLGGTSAQSAASATNAASAQTAVERSERMLGARSLLCAALQAGGVDDPVAQSHYWDKLKEFRDQCRHSRFDNPRDERAEAAFWFERMQRVLLTGPYQAECYRLDRTLDGGPYNCVTSTVIYVCICRQAGIDVQAVARAHHVYCRIKGPAPCDVQTTCPGWFDHLPGLYGTTPSEATDADRSVRLLSDRQLVAKVLYNRASALAARGEFSDAVPLLRRACQLDPRDRPARQNLVAAWNNWALRLSDAHCHGPAARKILAGLKIAPNSNALLANDLHVHHQWILSLCAEHRYEEALAILERCHRRRPRAELFDRGRVWVYEQWINWLIADGRIDKATAVLNTALARHPNAAELQTSRTRLSGAVKAPRDGV